MRIEDKIKREFVCRLKELLKLESQKGFSSNEWQELSRNFVRFIRSKKKILDLMEEEIWHYSADLDIRQKDQEYAARQRNYVIEFIEKIERANPNGMAD